EKKEHIIKLLHDEILNLLGNEKKELEIKKGNKTKIMLIGLYGAGKTTTISKLASYYQKRGLKVAMIGLDVHRPAATDQLEQLGEQTKIQVFTDKNEKNPIKIYNAFKDELEKFDLIVIDTAGRHSLDKELVSEIKTLTKTIKPEYKLLTIQADIGQAAKQQASEFQKAAEINGVIITRMDSTAKAGGALTACNETKAPVYFIGTGERINDFESFNPKSFISRLLGLGDLEGLLEKVQSATDEKSQKKLKEKLEKGEFNLRDLQEQLKSMSGMGSLSKIAEMIPGLGKAKIPDNLLGTQENKMKKWQHAINSMTEEEINNPELLEKQTSRLSRIAKGSGTSTSDIRQLIKQYKLLKEMTQTGSMEDFDPSQGLSQKQMMKLAKKFGK
ncbi:MAG: signal recognition particle protein Srp19, partial [Nanoarchaeota archaeon]|nr:signal recognition particle protein Srp19 [Nanoarchaeota archaeon]